MVKNNESFSTAILLVFGLITGCTTVPKESSIDIQKKTINLPQDHTPMYMNDFAQADMTEFLDGFIDYEYPANDVYFKGLYLSGSNLYGVMLDKSSHYSIGLFSLDTSNGNVLKLIQSDDSGYDMNIVFVDDNYMVYWIYSGLSSDLNIYYYDLNTDENTLVFHDPHSNELMNVFAEGDKGGFMYSCYNSEINDYEIRYVSLPSMETESVAVHSIMPVKAGDIWYFLSAEDENYEDRYLSYYDGRKVNRIDVNNLKGRITAISVIDDTHLLLIDTDLSSGFGHSYAYSIDLKAYTAEYLFETNSMIETVQTAGRFISWGAYTPEYGITANLFDMVNKEYYPLETHFIWLDNEKIAYRKYKMSINEAVQYYTLEQDVSCFSVRCDKD